jgi:TPR repeat protein
MSKHLKHLMYIIALILSVGVAACATQYGVPVTTEQYQPQRATEGDADAANALQRGRAAYDRQDYATAFREWRPLAQQGYAQAQHNLGVMYEHGLGVTRELVELSGVGF